MADPTTPQPLPPGVVPMEDAIRSQASLSGQAPRMNLGQLYEDYVASPLTQVVSRLVPQSPFQMPGSFDPSAPSTGPAKMVVPQNLTELGITAATLGAGSLASKAALTPGKAMLARVGGATLGGAVGKIADEGDVSAGTVARGAGQGALAGVTGEAIGAGINFARKAGMERSLAKRDVLDAAQVSDAIRNNPKLQGVFQDAPNTPEGLRDLVLGTVPDPKNPGKVIGKGEAMVKQYLNQQEDLIAQRLQQQEEQVGRKYFFPDPFDPGNTLPYDKARQQLSKLGDMAKRMRPQQTTTIGDETLYGGDVKQLYADTLRAWQRQFALIDSQAPQLPSALTAFNDSRGAYEAANGTLKLLEKAFQKPIAGRIAFDGDALQKVMSTKQKDLTNKLGEEGFWNLAEALRIPPERIGQRDVLAPKGLASQFAGVIPLPGAAYARLHIGSPHLVGNPFDIPSSARAGIDVGASQIIGRGLDLTPQQMLQGIPGLK